MANAGRNPPQARYRQAHQRGLRCERECMGMLSLETALEASLIQVSRTSHTAYSPIGASSSSAIGKIRHMVPWSSIFRDGAGCLVRASGRRAGPRHWADWTRRNTDRDGAPVSSSEHSPGSPNPVSPRRRRARGRRPGRAVRASPRLSRCRGERHRGPKGRCCLLDQAISRLSCDRPFHQGAASTPRKRSRTGSNDGGQGEASLGDR
jgi:hypothetical protein